MFQHHWHTNLAQNLKYLTTLINITLCTEFHVNQTVQELESLNSGIFNFAGNTDGPYISESNKHGNF